MDDDGSIALDEDLAQELDGELEAIAGWLSGVIPQREGVGARRQLEDLMEQRRLADDLSEVWDRDD